MRSFVLRKNASFPSRSNLSTSARLIRPDSISSATSCLPASRMCWIFWSEMILPQAVSSGSVNRWRRYTKMYRVTMSTALVPGSLEICRAIHRGSATAATPVLLGAGGADAGGSVDSTPMIGVRDKGDAWWGDRARRSLICPEGDHSEVPNLPGFHGAAGRSVIRSLFPFPPRTTSWLAAKPMAFVQPAALGHSQPRSLRQCASDEGDRRREE